MLAWQKERNPLKIDLSAKTAIVTGSTARRLCVLASGLCNHRAALRVDGGVVDTIA
jgi:hypothetical protein